MGASHAGRCQEVSTDTEKDFICFSFITMPVKKDLNGNFIGSVCGMCGHMDCIVFDPGRRLVSDSPEYKKDGIGRGIIGSLGKSEENPDRSHMALFNAYGTDRAAGPKTDCILRT